MALNIGSTTPITEFIDSSGNKQVLIGKKTVLYFYPKDNTPGCTAQACNLNENLDYLTAKGYQVIGVSTDSNKSHDKFISKFQLKFPLISDESHQIVEAFGVWVEKSMYGKSYMGIARTTFLIDEKGVISDIITKVDTKSHTEQIH
ncbi:thioredoxin-dependent thiol peroxidase [Aquirufa sp.]|jgi:peroxiredoxin Q/BCP|uniref:thioredoxin-dependent thiol peroxidase n=1 Tax=Aquirufa sp. TaxID=2676249 RepID=UPI0037BE922F